MDGRWCLENVVDRVWRRGRVLIDCLCVCVDQIVFTCRSSIIHTDSRRRFSESKLNLDWPLAPILERDQRSCDCSTCTESRMW
jgi:hypothetical protein